MKKVKFITIIVIFILGGGVLFQLFFNNIRAFPPDTCEQEIQNTDPIVIEYKPLGKAAYMDNPHHHKFLLLEPGAPFTMSLITDNDTILKSHEELFQFTGPSDFDFENHELFISFGRAVKELECVYYWDGCYTFIITYDKEYLGNEAFFYQIEKGNYIPPDFISECFLTDGEEKVFMGNQYALVTFQRE